MKGITINKLLLLVIGVLSFTGCSKVAKVYRNTEEISFKIPEITKATLINNATEINPFGLLGYKYPDGGFAAATPDWAYNYTVSEKAGIKTPDEESLFWPNTGKIRFFGFFPRNLAGLTLSSQTKTGFPYFDYTVPAGIANQKDLLAAQTLELEGIANDDIIPMNFKHILSAVSINASSKIKANFTVKEIKFTNIHNTARYDFGTDSWTTTGAVNDIEVPKEGTGSSNRFLLIPQIHTSDAKIKVTLTYNGKDFTLITPLTGMQWKKGYKVNFLFSLKTIYFVTYDIEAWNEKNKDLDLPEGKIEFGSFAIENWNEIENILNLQSQGLDLTQFGAMTIKEIWNEIVRDLDLKSHEETILGGAFGINSWIHKSEDLDV